MKQNVTPKFVAHHRQSDGASQSVKEHLHEASALASSFTKKIGLASFGELIGLLHDLGKYSGAFQTYMLSAVGKLDPDDEEYVDAKGLKGKIDHSSAGAQYVWEALQSQKPLQRLAGQIMSLCIASHHSGLIDCLSPNGSDLFSQRISKSKDKTHLDEVRIKADESIRSQGNELLASPVMEKELQKRLKSLFGDEPSREIREFKLGLLVRFLFSALTDADRLNTASFERKSTVLEGYNGKYPEWTVLIEKLENHLSGFKTRNQVDTIRNQISASCLNFACREKGLFQLTVPTGGGKTLASLRFALHHAKRHEMDRVIYVIPYTTIIDQNAGIVRSIFENNDNQSEIGGRQVVLEHHSNLTPEKDTQQSKILSENWDAPIVYTTAVQFLETLFAAGTRGARRMHQLANAVIIFDEIQTLPIKTVHLFNNAINFLVGQCNSTVVFCTATQPLLDKVDANKGVAKLTTNSQMMPDIGRLFNDLRRVEVLDKRKAGGWSEDEVAACTHEELGNAGSVLIIVNTKAQARAIYQRCRKDTVHPVFHLSTSMCPAHRMKVLSKIKECLDPDNPKPVICVSTQLIEAGVDVDFGCVIRYLAGLDSIAQAAGRCNRNGIRSTGRVLIINSATENLDSLSNIRTAKGIAERVLDEFRNDPISFDHDLISPAAMAQYYRYYFFDRAHEMTYPVSPKEVERADSLFSLLSTNELSVNAYRRANRASPQLHLRQSFKSAAEAFTVINAPTEGVIVPYGEEGKKIIADLSAAFRLDSKYDLLKKAQRYSVNMFSHEIDKLRQVRGIHEVQEGSGIMYLDSLYYSNDFGASVEIVGEMDFYEA